jgi:hypothetical protein
MSQRKAKKRTMQHPAQSSALFIYSARDEDFFAVGEVLVIEWFSANHVQTQSGKISQT